MVDATSAAAAYRRESAPGRCAGVSARWSSTNYGTSDVHYYQSFQTGVTLSICRRADHAAFNGLLLTACDGGNTGLLQPPAIYVGYVIQ